MSSYLESMISLNTNSPTLERSKHSCFLEESMVGVSKSLRRLVNTDKALSLMEISFKKNLNEIFQRRSWKRKKMMILKIEL